MRKANAVGTINKAKMLNKEALKIMDEKAIEIAMSLLDSTLKGHVLSARMLVELAEENMEADEAMMMRPLRSVALNLAEEPEWPGEVQQPAAETGVVSPVTVTV